MAVMPDNDSGGSDSDEDLLLEFQKFMEMRQHRRKRTRDIIQAAILMGTYCEKYMDKAPRRVPTVPGIDWVHKTLSNRTSCYNMFRMSSLMFHQLHDLLVEMYGLSPTRGVSTMEALGMFLWVIGAPQSLRQVEDRFVRSLETISRTFDKVLTSVLRLAVDIIKPKDPEFKTVHQRLRNPRFSPYFDNCIGAIDGTHVPVVVPNDKVVQHTGRHGYPSQNVLAVCDFDMRFTFVVSGWPGSVHDMRVFSDALTKYGDRFPHPPSGKFYLVDSGYPNRTGYLAPYKGIKYHLPEFRSGPMPKGMKETFNYAHSSLRNVIERSFGVLKMKWRILLGIPSFPMHKQSKIIVACMALHNFIRENDMADTAFSMYDMDENFVPLNEQSNCEGQATNTQGGEEDCNMNAFRDELARGLYYKS
nr:protein ALP1-like [Setaria viridis]